MKDTAEKAVAIVGVGAVMPDATNAKAFWENIKAGRYSISEVTHDRWEANLYYDPDPKAPDKTYSKIGGWVREWEWDPLKWRMPIPPRVSDAMDLTQKWAVVAAREALNDYGYPQRPLDPERTAVILGNAMGGDIHLYSAARVLFQEYAAELAQAPTFSSLPAEVRADILAQLRGGLAKRLPEITEDTMPGELSNIIAGRIASLYDFKGPNFVADAACASAMAGITAALEGLVNHYFDAVITGGIDANMSPSTYVKFCKIGALSATGTRPFAEGADGFVMGEGAAIFLVKRLADAERDGDRIYALIRGLGGSSDGRGKGITAPNPVGQKLAVRRGWENAGVVPTAGDLIEGHGTSTRVGDVVEVTSLAEAFGEFGLPVGSLALGSVKSNIGHLKGGAGAAGILKAVFSLHEKLLPPSLNFLRPNPDIDFTKAPFYVNTALKPWEKPNGEPRRAGVSAFGFGGTNFHTVLEEYVPGRIRPQRKLTVSVPETPEVLTPKTPLRGALVIGGSSEAEIVSRLKLVHREAEAGRAPEPVPPSQADLRAPIRLTIDYGNAAELAEKSGKALKAFAENQASRWKMLRAKGIFLGRGSAANVAFLFTGQGSQYVNMLRTLRDTERVVTETFKTADAVMTPLLGRPLRDCIFLDEGNEKAMAEAEEGLKQTAITQPAVLATETAISRLLNAYGVFPDMVMGHSLGEYGALVAAGALSFEEALRAVSARGTEMTRCALDDNGMMAAVFGPIPEIEQVLSKVEGYVVVANINSTKEAVIGGTTQAVELAMEAVREAGYVARPLQVSHAFHTQIVAPASEALTRVLEKMDIRPPTVKIISNVTGEFYPMGPGVVPEMIALLGKQVSSPVQFVKGLRTLYDAGARVFVEIGPKRVLYGFVEDVLGEREGVWSLFTNHPRIGDLESFNLALCGLYAAGLGAGVAAPASDQRAEVREQASVAARSVISAPAPQPPGPRPSPAIPSYQPPASGPRIAAPGGSHDRITQLGNLFAEFLERGFQIYSGGASPVVRPETRVVVSGASLGLPGVDRVFDDSNAERILRGDNFIEPIPMELRRAMLEKNVTRLVKTGSGEGRFETIEKLDEVIKLAARAREYDLVRDFGFPEERMAALDHVTKLAIGAGIDALRDAGIPLVMRYKTTTKGTKLPDRWMLPDELRDDTGLIFGSAFPGCDSFADIITGFYRDKLRRERLDELTALRALAGEAGSALVPELDRRIATLREDIDKQPYHFDRRFLFRVLSMGHSQFAEYIGARGPNTAINAACATGTQALSVARDWIESGRCRRAIIISADDITSDNLMGWHGAGFLASGAAATDEVVEDAATPFDRRRHGLIVGMGAAAMVLESEDAVRERGLRPICEVLGTITANSAFHGTRLDVSHICQVMEKLIADAEARWGINRFEIAPQTVFVSHETYTPARGGSASAEVFALRHVFKDSADKIVVANTKGSTGHPMAVGVEDVVAVKILETGLVPPVQNFREVDPELGLLNLSRGGPYPVQYALRLGAGFGSQIAMTLARWTPTPDGRRPSPGALGFAGRIENPAAWQAWIKRVSGFESPEVEIVNRTLRIKDQGPGARVEAAPSAARVAGPVAPAPTSVVIPPSQAQTPEPARVEPPPAPAVTPTSPQISTVDAVQERVMRIISEKTGYPTDMLQMDLDLEADLGIDTVKQAEMFAAIRAAYDIPRDDTLKLRDFPTLAHTIQFVYDRRPDLKPSTSATPVQPPAPSTQPPATSDQHPVPTPQPSVPSPQPSVSTEDEVRATVVKIIAEKTGYPTDMLDLDLDLEADLGIDTVKQAEMFAAIRAAYDIPRDDTLKLRDFPTLAHTIQFVYDRRPDLKPSTSATPVQPPVPSSQPPAASYQQPATSLQLPVPSPQSSVSTEDEVRATVVKIIAEKTGYPTDMLDLDLDLEADLGIDTVKQAEMFAAIRAAYDIPRDDALKLRDFPTLAHAIQFVYDRRPDLKPGVSATPVQPPATGGQPPATSYQQPATSPQPPVRPQPAVSLDAANAVARRIPTPRQRPSLKFCKPTGVVLGAESRVVVMPDQGGVAKALLTRLEKRGVRAFVVEGAPDAETLTAQLETLKSEGAVQGVYWLSALDQERDILQMDLAAWREAARVRVKLLYATMRALYDQVGAEGTFLVSATRMGGLHGYDDSGALSPMGGAVSGFTKAFKREKNGALVKVVDFETGRKSSTLADRLLDETLSDPGVVEIGYRDGQRWAIGLSVKPAADGKPGMTLGKDTVFVITGAAGSIVSAITADLAAASGGTFHLLDLAPRPDPSDPDLRRYGTDRDNLKRDIFERLKVKGERATPAMVEKELAALERLHAAQTAIEAVSKAGGLAHYYSVNLLDGPAVAAVMQQVAERSGRIDVLVHAAGLEISRLLPDKSPKEYDLVFDVKADGWFNLLSSLGSMPLEAAIVFSSVAGRFGNTGQTDYSAANDLLCKYVSSFKSTRPATRGIAIDWTAWGGIGMATRGSIPTIMKQAGIDMLPPEAGIPTVRRELTEGGTRDEIVVAGRLGMMMEEFDPSGGLDLSESGALSSALSPKGVMVGAVRGLGLYQGLVIETELDPAKQPFLYDHQIGGTPVLPGVMGIEGLVETAKILFPERRLGVVEEVSFSSPFKFYRGQTRTVTLAADFCRDGHDTVAVCTLMGSRLLHGQTEHEVTTHFTARVRLVDSAPARGKRPKIAAPPDGRRATGADIYRLYFHGPAYRVIESAWRSGDELIGKFALRLPPNHDPASLPLLAAPRLIELCFQTAGLWELANQARMGLPYRIDRLQIFPPVDESKGLFAAIVRRNGEGFDGEVVDEKGNILLAVAGYRTMQLPDPVDGELLKPLQGALL